MKFLEKLDSENCLAILIIVLAFSGVHTLLAISILLLDLVDFRTVSYVGGDGGACTKRTLRCVLSSV